MNPFVDDPNEFVPIHNRPQSFGTNSGDIQGDLWRRYQALNYSPNNTGRQTVQDIHHTIDLAIVEKIVDMGHGVLVVEIPNIQENKINDIHNALRALHNDPNIFPDYNHSDIRVEYLNKLSVSKNDSFIGLFKCGDGEYDRYKLVIKSYSMKAAKIFQATIKKTLKNLREQCKEQSFFRKVCESELNIHEFIEGDCYAFAISRSLVHRIKLAKYIFEKIGISLPPQYCMGGNEKSVIAPQRHEGNESLENMKKTKQYQKALANYISTEHNNSMCQDYLTVFMKPRIGGKSLLLHNHVYDSLSLHHGAPFFLLPHQGFVTYRTNIQTLQKVSSDIHHPAGPTGVSFCMMEGNSNSILPEVATSIREKLLWISQLDVTYIGNPNNYGDPTVERDQVEREFSLGPRYCHWRCCTTIFSVPDETVISWEDFCDYGTEEIMHIPIESWDSLFTLYSDIRQEWKIRTHDYPIDGNTEKYFPPTVFAEKWAHKKHPGILSFDNLPHFSKLFGTHPLKKKLQATYTKSYTKICNKKESSGEEDGEHLAVAMNDMCFLANVFHFFLKESPYKGGTVEERGDKKYEEANYTESEAGEEPHSSSSSSSSTRQPFKIIETNEDHTMYNDYDILGTLHGQVPVEQSSFPGKRTIPPGSCIFDSSDAGPPDDVGPPDSDRMRADDDDEETTDESD